MTYRLFVRKIHIHNVRLRYRDGIADYHPPAVGQVVYRYNDTSSYFIDQTEGTKIVNRVSRALCNILYIFFVSYYLCVMNKDNYYNGTASSLCIEHTTFPIITFSSLRPCFKSDRLTGSNLTVWPLEEV